MYPILTIGGLKLEMFYVFGYFCIFLMVVFNVLNIRRKKTVPGWSELFTCSKRYPKLDFLKSEGLFLAIETILLSVGQVLSLLTVNYPFGKLLTDGNANYFGTVFTAPLIFTLFCIILGTDPIERYDIHTVGYPLALMFSKIGCFCHGCCAGFECDYGMYNHEYDKKMFPVQLVEAGLALLIFFILLFWSKKAKKGTVYPVYVILYSGTRFFSEFLRMEDNYVWILKKYHLLCIAGVIFGVVLLVLMNRYAERISSFFAGRYASEKEKYRKKHTKNIIHHKR